MYLFAHTAIPKRNWYSYFGVLPIYGLEHNDEINDEIVLMLWDIKMDTHPFFLCRGQRRPSVKSDFSAET